MSTSSIRERLRQAGGELHQQVDALFSSYRLTDLDGYQTFLVAHAWALFPMEEMLESSGIEAMMPDWKQRRRRFALAEDLAMLGVSVPEYKPLQACSNEATLWGYAYVLEGSRLGGKMIARYVAGSDEPLVRAATHYLSHVPDSGPAGWPAFLAELEHRAVHWKEDDLFSGQSQAFGLFLQAGQRFQPVASSIS
ncbi:biliverdin-producing heme oxygenase [Pseudomonas sp.]|uniref:biliverdin-producing heme oxygenase n=1 Tax=Pseudomonas sp. TaxID=306 RepID=UPI00289AE319|nr:biliverdin-producing heme oxygenase [Pseudomonas sp.]